MKIQIKNPLRRLRKFLASLQLAVVVIVAIGVITAIGTIIESQYDAYAAKKIVYDTPWMYAIMIFLCINLIAVMVDRWPWKLRHLPFISAHVGIILLLIGAAFTSWLGVDGSMRIGIGEKSQFITVNDTDLVMYATFDGDRYSKIFDQPVDFFNHPPTEKSPFVLPIANSLPPAVATKSLGSPGEDKSSPGSLNPGLRIVDYVKYAIPMRKVVESQDQKRGAGLRFQLKNTNVNLVEWLLQRNAKDPVKNRFGLATLILGDWKEQGQGENEIYFKPNEQGKIKYIIYHKDSLKAYSRGVLSEGDAVPTGWMGMELRLIRFLPKAQDEWDLQIKDRPTPMTTSALRVEFQDKSFWLLLNDTLKVFTENEAYLLLYQNRRIDLGFPVSLKEFQVTRYKGSNKAMEYQSLVSTPQIEGQLISMNEPMKNAGFTFYQASFESDENNRPVASILSVNRDPGRWLKYLGSLIMTLGIVLLFWFKKIGLRKTAMPMVKDSE